MALPGQGTGPLPESKDGWRLQARLQARLDSPKGGAGSPGGAMTGQLLG